MNEKNISLLALSREEIIHLVFCLNVGIGALQETVIPESIKNYEPQGIIDLQQKDLLELIKLHDFFEEIAYSMTMQNKIDHSYGGEHG